MRNNIRAKQNEFTIFTWAFFWDRWMVDPGGGFVCQNLLVQEMYPERRLGRLHRRWLGLVSTTSFAHTTPSGMWHEPEAAPGT
jgi:hypothetical protein